MSEDPIMAIMDGCTVEMRDETGIPPSGWMVAKRLAARVKTEMDKRKEWELKYHELMHRTGMQ